MRSPEELARVLDGVPVVQVAEQNSRRNVGDHWSAVARSVGWVEKAGEIVSLYEAQELATLGAGSPIHGKLVIVGGSGLVGPNRFEAAVESLWRQHPAAVVIWGIGHNWQHGTNLDPTTGWRPRVMRDGGGRIWPDWLARADLAGVRDRVADIRWVPCASALLPALDYYRDTAPDLDLTVINHYERAIPTRDLNRSDLRYVHLTNNTEDINETLSAIARSPVVVTNTYHVGYWSLLLGRGVVFVGANSTRFYGLPWAVRQATPDNWMNEFPRATASLGALKEARDATRRYSSEVMALGRDLGLIGPEFTMDPHAPAELWQPPDKG